MKSSVVPPFDFTNGSFAVDMPESRTGPILGYRHKPPVSRSQPGQRTHQQRVCTHQQGACTHACLHTHSFTDCLVHVPRVLQLCRIAGLGIPESECFLQVQQRVLNEARSKQHTNKIVPYLICNWKGLYTQVIEWQMEM